MKKISFILLSIALFVFVGCGEEFLDRPSKTQMDDGNFWSSEQNLRLFVNGAYENYFNGYANSWGQQYAPGVYSSGEMSDDARTVAGQLTNFITAVPDDNWYRTDDQESGYGGTYWLYRTGAGPWNFGFIRKWNLMIERLNTMKEEGILPDEAYNHWMGVARFLRGFEYYRFVGSFGDVPWYDHVVASTDLADQYKDRDSRVEVMKHVMEDMDFAIQNVRADDGKNYINKYVVAAYASRFMLFEGTWEKYHKVSGGDPKAFLEKAVSYAKVVMDSGKYHCDTDFRSLFGSETQVGTEAIIFRSYSAELSCTHCIASYANLDESQAGFTNLAFLKSIRCIDGKPYTASTVAGKDSWALADMVKTRDPRFEATFWDEPNANGAGIYCVKFIDRIGPTYAFNGQPRPAKYGSMTNTNGYPCIRYAEVLLNYAEAKQELALSYGGAAFTQADADATINEIRNRPLDADAIEKGVQKTAPLKINDIADDPMRTSAPYANTFAGVVNDPLLWEIRQERRLEFFMEQVRVLDIRRWGELELMDGDNNPDIMVGAWVDLNNTRGLRKGFDLLFNNDGSRNSSTYGVLKVQHLDGTVVTWGADTDPAQMVGFRIPNNIKNRNPFSYKNYLEPVCNDVIKQYDDAGFKITQNPGW